MRIEKIKFNQEGMKGLTVKYVENSVREGISFSDEHSVVYKAPVHTELRALNIALRDHLKAYCGLNIATAYIEVIGLTISAGRIIVSGKVITTDDGVYAISTPNIPTDSEYPEYDDLDGLVEQVVTQTQRYVKESIMASPKQFAMEFNKDLTEKDFDKMTAGAQKKMMVEALEKSGAVVIESDDIETEVPNEIETAMEADDDFAEGTVIEMAKVANG